MRLLPFFLIFSLFLLACTTQISQTTVEKTSPPSPSPATPVQEQTPPAIQPSTPHLVEINMIAKKFSFEPSEIRVHKGDHVKIHVKSVDVPHGIRIEDYDINVGLPPNEEKTVDFIADKVGTFDFECSVYCGSGHGSMEGKLIVEE